MKPFGTLDIETDPFQRTDSTKPGRIPKAFAGAIFDGKRTGMSWSESCLDYIVTECVKPEYKDYIWYAHNGGKFDFHYLLRPLLKIFDMDLIELMCIGSRIVKIKTPACEFRDSYALIPKALKDIAYAHKKQIEIWKLESNFTSLTQDQKETFIRDFNDDSLSPRIAYKKEITAYLKQDVQGLHGALELFFGKYGQEITLASTCFKVLKKQFGMPEVRSNILFDERFRQFYFAGRVEFFGLGEYKGELGEKRYNICDINSAFPWAMRQEHFFSPSCTVTDTIPKNNKEQCFYEVTCDSDGILPRREAKGAITFPVVKSTRFFATGWELFAGLELGKIRNEKIHAIHVPLELRSFADYIDHFYALKLKADKEKDEAERTFNKLFMNGAYGKFALNPREFRDIKITKLGEIPADKTIKLKNNKTIVKVWEHSYDDIDRGLSFWQMPSNGGEKPFRFNNVATAASITGCVRAFLARSIAQCKGVLYCDTDSIICEDCSKLIFGDDIGQWKLEKECDYIAIGGKKLYAARDYRGKPSSKEWKEWKTASKGVRLSAEEICAVARGEVKSYSFEAPNYSVFSGVSFTTRKVRRDDQRKK